MKKYYLTFIILISSAFDIITKPLYEKYANSPINLATLVERQGLKYQVNTSKPFSENFLALKMNWILCKQGRRFKNGLLHGEYEGCGVFYTEKAKYKNGSENGRYQAFEEGYLIVEGNVVNDKLEGEWISYDYGLITFKENYKNDQLLSFEEFSYYDNGQVEFIRTYNSDELLHGIFIIIKTDAKVKRRI